LTDADRERLRAVDQALQKPDIPRAIELARAALDAGTVHPALLNLRALWLERQSREADAHADLLKARAMAPDDAAINNALGLSFARQNRMIEAARAFAHAAACRPSFAHAHFNSGWAHETLGELDIARANYERALALDPQRPETLSRLASLAARRADWTVARDLASRALSIDAGQTDARLALAEADIAGGHEAAAETALRALIGDDRLGCEGRYLAYGVFGDLLHRQGRYDDAFNAYRTGNAELRKANAARYAGEASIRPALAWMTGAIEKSGPWIRPATAGGENECARHVFLLGFIRTGTTLLERILTSRPDTVSLDEKEAFADATRAFLADARGFERLRVLDAEGCAHYRRAYWRRVRESGVEPAGKIFVDKLPFNTLKLPLIARLFPDAKIIFAMRDPRDVLLSSFRRRFRINPYIYELLDLEAGAQLYDAFMALAGHYRAALPLDLIAIRNEDLIADFDGEIGRLCAFLGLAWDERMRDFAAGAGARAIATPGAEQIMRGLNRDGVGVWRHYRDKMAPVLPVLAPWVETFGYKAG
jgi:Tfp pilus assembly protein PilF